MSASLTSPATADLAVGQEWTIKVKASELPGLVVFLPDGEQFTPAINFEAQDTVYEWPDVGTEYVATVPLLFPGRYLAAVVAGSTVLVTAQAFATQTAVSNIPDFEDLDAYLGQGAHSWTTGELQEAIEIEAAAQRRVCRTPAIFPPDLRAALLRRAARFLDMKRRQTQQDTTGSDFEVPSTVAIGRDQEIRRYEAPWRKVVAG